VAEPASIGGVPDEGEVSGRPGVLDAGQCNGHDRRVGVVDQLQSALEVGRAVVADGGDDESV
jgi:hydroxylamine reductase (hybrid-cluster protein)